MKRFAAVIALLAILPLAASGETENVYTVTDQKGMTLTLINYEPSKDDEYIASDNRHFRITAVDLKSQTATAELIGLCDMPDVSWLDDVSALEVNALLGPKRIALYCTHSDESYVTGDGTESKQKDAGIYDVAQELAERLAERGVDVKLDSTGHNPHDAGAYRRSRQTAAKLVKSMPDAIFDIHRDGIPDPEQYKLRMGGADYSKVRLLVGRGNQNASANKAFAVQLKAVADKVYPGLIKDIYMGKGVYNQDLYPKSLLLEMGTHTLPKERVMRTQEPLSDVIYRTLYGGLTGAAGASDVTMDTPVTESNEGTGSGIAWLLGIAAALGGLMSVVSTGSFKGAGEKLKRTAGEMTGGLIGKKTEK